MAYDEHSMARLYDGDYAHLRTTSGDVDFYVARAVAAGGPVLELGCGTGRILIPSARTGVEIAGLDSSEAMLDRLRANLEGEAAEVRDRVTAVHADMRDFSLGREFALVTLPFRAFGHVLEIDEQLSTLAAVRRHLMRGGRLILDFFVPDFGYLAEPRPDRLQFERTEGDRTIRRFVSTDPDRNSQVNHIVFRWEIESPGGAVEEVREEFLLRWFHRFEMEHLFARAGFEIEELLGDFAGSPFGPESREMIFVARPA